MVSILCMVMNVDGECEILDGNDGVYRYIKSGTFSESLDFKDRLGNQVYEGDVAYVWIDDAEYFGMVGGTYSPGVLYIKGLTQVILPRDFEIEVVGNVWDGNKYD